MKENNKTEEVKKSWAAPVLVEYGDVNALTQSRKKFNTDPVNFDCFAACAGASDF